MAFCDPFKQNLKRHIATDLISDFSAVSGDRWFVGIGRVSEWSSPTGSSQDIVPPSSVDSDQDDTQYWRNLLAAKRITRDDVSLVVPRYDWSSGEVYTPYRNDIDLFNDISPSKFYVLVDEERVYKCIDNFYGAASTVPPTHTDSQVRTLSDGYRWKFIFQIPESKRKFLTKTFLAEGTSVGAISRQGYMPVEFVDFLRLNDDRSLQYAVQQSAINGEIVFTEFKQQYRSFVVSDNTCLLNDPATPNLHQGISITGASGGTAGDTFIGYSTSLVGASGHYVDRILSIDTGNLIGSRRTITAYEYNPSNSQGTFRVVPPFPANQVLSNTFFTVVPKVEIDGDGRNGSDPSNPALGHADISVKFGDSVTGVTACSGAAGIGRRFVSSFEMVDTGRDYTYATVSSVAGLTFYGITGDIADIALPVISPPNGHGSNPVVELGAAALMVVTDFDQDEDGYISTKNEFRQFGIIKNPRLYAPIIDMFLSNGGVTGSFATGGTATQGFTGSDGSTGFENAAGRIVGWMQGWSATGQTAYGSSNLRVTGISGSFEMGGVIESNGLSFGIVALETLARAGAESREVTAVEIVSQDPITLAPTDYRRGQHVQGIGNIAANVSPSRATGRVYSYTISAGSLNRGTLYLEDVKGAFNEGERIVACDYFLRPLGSLTSSHKVGSFTDTIVGGQSVYRTTTRIAIDAGTAGGLFTSASFPEDSVISFSTGGTSGVGTVVEWSVTSGATATAEILLSGVNGTFIVGGTASYEYEDSTFTASIVTIDHLPDLRYRSGEVSYIQNIRPIPRGDDQREEIKVVITF